VTGALVVAGGMVLLGLATGLVLVAVVRVPEPAAVVETAVAGNDSGVVINVKEPPPTGSPSQKEELRILAAAKKLPMIEGSLQYAL
jgi:hypothetical protein